MADIKLSIVNMAITAAGEETLSSLTPESDMARAAIENYESFVLEELENGTWKFASKTVTPNLQTARADCPLQYQWQIPLDCIELIAVLYRNVVLDGDFFQIEQRVIRCQYGTDITIKYGFRPDESTWPQRFCRIIVGRLKALFLEMTERHVEAGAAEERTDMRSKIAKHTEARQQRNRPLGDGTIAQARLGGRRRRFF